VRNAVYCTKTRQLAHQALTRPREFSYSLCCERQDNHTHQMNVGNLQKTLLVQVERLRSPSVYCITEGEG